MGKCEFGEKFSASPAFFDGRIYIRGKERLYCIGTNGASPSYPSFEEVMWHLGEAMGRPDCVLDVETDRDSKALLCLGISYHKNSAICIPLGPTTKRWTPQEEVEIWRRVQDLFTGDRIGRVGQNIGVDMNILQRYVG